MPAPPDPPLKTCATPEPMFLKAATNVYPVTPTNTLLTDQLTVPSVKQPTAKVVPLAILVNVRASPQAVAII